MMYIALFAFGIILGSFLNCCIYRLPLEKSVVLPRSFCPRCKVPIKWYDNVPLISYILLLGKCRSCARKISIRYPLVELLSGFCSVFVFYYFQEWVPYIFYYIFLISPLIIVTFIDLEHRLIPDVITIPGIVVGAASQFILMHGSVQSISLSIGLGIIVGGGFLAIVGYGYELIKKREGLGGGDVKLAAMFGAFFGWKGVVFILFISSIVGSIVGIILIIAYKRDLKHAIPYGPFLALGAVIYLFFGDFLLNWYLGLF